MLDIRMYHCSCSHHDCHLGTRDFFVDLYFADEGDGGAHGQGAIAGLTHELRTPMLIDQHTTNIYAKYMYISYVCIYICMYIWIVEGNISGNMQGTLATGTLARCPTILLAGELLHSYIILTYNGSKITQPSYVAIFFLSLFLLPLEVWGNSDFSPWESLPLPTKADGSDKRTVKVPANWLGKLSLCARCCRNDRRHMGVFKNRGTPKWMVYN